MAGNSALNKAGIKKEDEFYTQLSDIEKELKHYREQFRDRIIFCNCDDPAESNFFRYFQLNFYSLGIKKLICTHFDREKTTYKLEIISDGGSSDGNNIPEYIRTELQGNGDFRSPECLKILEEADIVVTNPPFSLFHEFLSVLLEHDKKFLIIGSQNNITYKDIFPLLRDGKVWLGYYAGDMAFMVPDYYEPRATRFWIDETGQKWRSFGNMCWFTNLDINKRHEDLILYRKYQKDDYRFFDNYDAIFIEKVADIPMDYEGVMGVPITFLYKHNPDQFEIIGLLAGNIKGLAGIPSKIGKDGPYLDGKLKYGRILIRRKVK